MTIYEHYRSTSKSSKIREVIFGLEDGMVSTLGAITGIAVGSDDPFVVILAGVVLISVESFSMAIGSYISNQSEYEINQQIIEEEKEEIRDYPEQESEELLQLFVRDGWPKDLAQQMTEAAAKKPELMLNEMVHRELLITHESASSAFKNSLLMFFSYMAGGALPIIAYLLLPIKQAMPVSVGVTLLGLFSIGVYTANYAKASWLKSGLRILLLGVVSLSIGYLIGEAASLIK